MTKSETSLFARQLLTRNLNRFQQRMNRTLLDQFHGGYEKKIKDEVSANRTHLKSIPRHARAKWIAESGIQIERRLPENAAARSLFDFLARETETSLARLKDLRSRNTEFRCTIAKTEAISQRKQIILDYAQDLGASPADLRKDARAVSRHLDEDAMNDRFVRLMGEAEQRLAFALERLGELTSRIVEIVGRGTADRPDSSQNKSFDQTLRQTVDSKTPDQPRNIAAAETGWKVAALRGFWNRAQVEKFVQQALIYEGDVRVRLAAMKCLSSALAPMPSSIAGTLLQKPTLAYFQAAALDRSLDVWLQCEAMSILQRVAPEDLPTVIDQRLSKPDAGDDMFVRRHAVSLLANCFVLQTNGGSATEASSKYTELLSVAMDDQSDFVRQQVAVAACHAPPAQSLECLERLALHDPCGKVRAATLVAMLEHAAEKHMTKLKLLEFIHVILAEEEDELVVRTAMFLTCQTLEQRSSAETASNAVAFSDTDSSLPLTINSDSLSTRADSADGGRSVSNSKPANRLAEYIVDVIVPDLFRLESRDSTPVRVRRWSAQARERIWLHLDTDARRLRDRLTERISSVRPGKGRRIPRTWLKGFDSDTIGRILAVMAQDDFGYDLDRDWFGFHLIRGPVFRFRFWRFWYELRNPATDKRQAISHTIGRTSDATIRAPSQILGEQSQTKVPGEPLVFAKDGNWRPFLPLVDDLISALNRNWFVQRTVRFYTSQGVTELKSPESFLGKLRATWQLSFRFAHYAKLRNWDKGPSDPAAYLQEIQSLGFKVEIRPHAENLIHRTNGAKSSVARKPHDNSVAQFFPCCALLAFGFPDVWHWGLEYAKYFSSAYENSLIHLVLFVVLLLVLFFTRHWLANFALRRARRRIPLSIGGWGTRGKSGTERLKAALIGGMGHGLISKTTGCEAMFIQAHAFGLPLEIPLFRPYDKATIWEQVNLLKMASKLKPSAFLWECMGLTPSYVEVLSRQWMCDDLATITNTYPDHEDLQGPTGYNVATTVSGFVPPDSLLLTTEQEMRPLVAESCRSVGTSLRAVGWLQSGLITDDVQARFPYKEHVDNIALVAAMGEELGVTYEFAVKAMADYLVPDLGVLKVYPVAEIRNRRVEFTNGMSANERFGCLGNWNRMGFADRSLETNPGTWITGVVNNRDDRIPRSKVFASIMVHDISVDRFILIGNNLSGLQGFIAEAWDDRAKLLKLLNGQAEWEPDAAIEMLVQTAKDLRVPTSRSEVESALQAMVSTCREDQASPIDDFILHWNEPDKLRKRLKSHHVSDEIAEAIYSHHETFSRSLLEYETLIEAFKSTTAATAQEIEKRFQDQAKAWFMRKIVVIEDYDATGEEVIHRLVEETPPGFLNRAMGLQNIKGTGLDFVYRFQTWDACYNACEQILHGGPSVAVQGLQTLSSMPEIGQLCEQKVQTTLDEALKNAHFQSTELQVELNTIAQKLENSRHSTSLDSDAVPSGRSVRRRQFLNWFWNSVEQYCDVNDSVQRRNDADQVYKDLVSGRISRPAAIARLRKINKRQKGGWLAG